ncbi:MAG: hypothetical protein QMD99_26460, partial [Rhizobiaceae bacterium]|nr:hypothetical protein [Rhizobiaceae bacterium]
KIEINIKRNNGNKEISCYESEDKQNYAASSPLVGRPGKHWCVDSRGGVPREVDTAVATSSCP